MRYRTKPSFFVDAAQFDEDVRPFPTGVTRLQGQTKYVVDTPIGPMIIENKDWLVRNDAHQCVFPVRDEHFKRLYEAAPGRISGGDMGSALVSNARNP